MPSLFVTGDTHARPANRIMPDIADERMKPGDFLIVCGDWGLPFGVDNPDHEFQYELDQAGWLQEQGIHIIALFGNHDDRNAAAKMPRIEYATKDYKGTGRMLKIQDKCFRNITIVDEPCVWEILGKKCLMIPGAKCHAGDADIILDPRDINFYDDEAELLSQHKWYRIKGWSWWPDEDVNIPALKKIVDSDKNFDYIFSHEGPTTYLLKDNPYFYNVWRSRWLSDRDITDAQRYLSELMDTLNFEHYWFAHYHDDLRLTDKISLIYWDVQKIYSDE